MRMKPKVAIIMGSASDYPVMQEAESFVRSMGVEIHVEVVSAHRTPEKMMDFAKSARDQGIHIIIAGAGGAAHLPGMVASLTTLPVIGVPIKSSNSLDGWDSILSILQMPKGIPVATVALNGGKNAGILAIRILSIVHPELTQKLVEFTESMKEDVEISQRQVNQG